MLGVKLLYYCFIRPGEARNLKVKHLDFEELQICVPAELSKNKKTQFVKVPKPFIFELSKFKNEPVENFILGGAVQIAQNYLYRKHNEILKALGFSSEYSLYSWKHTGVVRAYKSGVGLKELQMQLRHYNLEMVSIYLKSLGIDDIDISSFPAI